MLPSLTLLAFLALAPTQAASTETPAPPKPAVSADMDKEVCRSIPEPGRRIARRQCMRKSDWARYDSALNEALQRSSSFGGAIGPSCLASMPCARN